MPPQTDPTVAVRAGGWCSRNWRADSCSPRHQPNFVFILTDDQDTETVQYMPRVQELLAEQGATFENTFVTNPVCCPSNVSILTGQYSHNHQILHNVPPHGGFQKFVNMRTDGDPATLGDENTLATWLHDAGYLTGRVGKYLVGYPDGSTYIPPGWDQWLGSYDGFSSYYNYGVNENGTVVQYGDRPEDYLTDVLTEQVVAFIGPGRSDRRPAVLRSSTPRAPRTAARPPNGAPTPAPRHLGTFAGAQAAAHAVVQRGRRERQAAAHPQPAAAHGRPDRGDRPASTRPGWSPCRRVDEGVGRIIDALGGQRRAGQHLHHLHLRQRLPPRPAPAVLQGKGEAYEEDIRVPLWSAAPASGPASRSTTWR